MAKKETLNDETLTEVTGATEIVIGEDGRVKNTLEPTNINLQTAGVIQDIITPTIPNVKQ